MRRVGRDEKAPLRRVQGRAPREGAPAAEATPPLPPPPLGAEFNGSDYDHDFDHARLTGQIKRVFDCMSDRAWRTLAEIEALTGDPPASISAQLRHLRKRRFGSYSVLKRPRGERERGLWEYQLGAPESAQGELELERDEDQ